MDLSVEEMLTLSPNDAKKLLQKLREKNVRQSYDIAKLYYTAISSLKGIDYYAAKEQVMMASFDSHNPVYSVELNMLYNTFYPSNRVARLYACKSQCEGDYKDALEALDAILKADETNAPARKRRVAIYKEQGLIAEAIKELVDYLKKYMSDMEGWQELCQLYLRVGELQKATFCAEELLLHQPHNHLFHQMLADVYYTMGGLENMELAKTYYCHALKLNPNNMRAMLALILVTNNLLGHYKSSGNSNKRKEIWRLNQWAISCGTKRQKESTANLTSMMLSLSVQE